jgi:hypothetical protein
VLVTDPKELEACRQRESDITLLDCIYDIERCCNLSFLCCYIQVLVTDPKELEAIRQRESDITKERIQKILDAGEQALHGLF